MTLDQIADEAWEYFRAMRNPNWTEEQNVKALVRGALTDPFIKIDSLRAEVERLSRTLDAEADRPAALREELRRANLQVSEYRKALEELMKIASQWGGCTDTGTESPFGMTWTLDPSERKDWDNAMLGAERVLNATPDMNG